MERKELERLISRYEIQDLGNGRLRAAIQKDDPLLAIIRESKPEILQILAEQREQVRREIETERRRTETIEKIPGYLDLRNAIRAEVEYSEKFSLAMERGDGFLPTPPQGPSSKELAARYTEAAFAYEINRKRFSPNNEFSSLAQEAYVDSRPPSAAYPSWALASLLDGIQIGS